MLPTRWCEPDSTLGPLPPTCKQTVTHGWLVVSAIEKTFFSPDDTGRDPVVGELVASGVHEIVIRRSDPAVGEVCVHFPRAGFVVMSA